MTGFGDSEKVTKSSFIKIEIKSVNNRFLDAQFKIPKSLMPLESKMKSMIESKVTRGSILCSIQFESGVNNASALKLNQDLLSQYLDIMKEMGDKVGDTARFELTGLLKIPELITMDSSKIDIDELEKEVFPIFESACDALVASRIKEGENLSQSIYDKASTFESVIKSIQSVLPDRQKEVQEKYKKRIDALIERESSVSQERIMIEIGLLSEKLDIDEEIVRFNSHLELFMETLQSSTPGKKLGFVLQEMLREVNTMSSKCQYAPIQHKCVTLKEEMEKIREQCLNLE